MATPKHLEVLTRSVPEWNAWRTKESFIPDLRAADLSAADLSAADLSAADLSDAKGLQTAQNFLEQFDKDEVGVLVYKAIGNTLFPAPKKWQIEPGAVLTEVVNPDRGTLCGCGVNFATLEWVQTNHPESQIWKCRIRWLDLADVVVPFGTDGKARCARLELLEIVTPVKTKTKTTHTKAAA